AKLNAGTLAASDSWIATTTTGAPSARVFHTAVWTGSEMVVWGGSTNSSSTATLNTGGKYNPVTDSWSATTTTGAPPQRDSHTSVWTGSEMILWGGADSSLNQLGDGGRYNPTSDTWSSLTTNNAPAGRVWPRSVWTGSKMIIWGGWDSGFEKN